MTENLSKNAKLILLLSMLANIGVCFLGRSFILLVIHVLLAILCLARLFELLLKMKTPGYSGIILAWLLVAMPAMILVFKLFGFFASMGMGQIIAEITIFMLGMLLAIFGREPTIAEEKQRKNP